MTKITLLCIEATNYEGNNMSYLNAPYKLPLNRKNLLRAERCVREAKENLLLSHECLDDLPNFKIRVSSYGFWVAELERQKCGSII